MHQSSALISIDVLLFRTTANENNLPSPTCSNDGPLNPNELSLLPPTVKAQNFLCRTRTNAKGEYTFDDVPVGLYAIVCWLNFVCFFCWAQFWFLVAGLLDRIVRNCFHSRSESSDSNTQRFCCSNAVRNRNSFVLRTSC